MERTVTSSFRALYALRISQQRFLELLWTAANIHSRSSSIGFLKHLISKNLFFFAVACDKGFFLLTLVVPLGTDYFL